MRKTKELLIAGFSVVMLMAGAHGAAAYDCRGQDSRVVQAINSASARASQPGANAATAYCAQVNSVRAMIWKSRQCLENDPTLNETHRSLVQGQLAELRRSLRQAQEGYRALSSGSSCNCWSNVCAE